MSNENQVEWEIESAIKIKVSQYLDKTYGSVTIEGVVLPMSVLITEETQQELYDELFMKFVDEFQKDLDKVLDNLEIDTYA